MEKYFKILPVSIFLTFVCFIILIADIYGTNTLQGLAPGLPQSDKLGHLMAFGVLALLTNFALDFKKIRVLKCTILIGSMAIALFAITEEFSQLFLETRSFDLVDMLFDFLGISVCSFIPTSTKKFKIYS
ncbi:VanZ family protein [Marinoscillum sp. MHG1-6]|uniref:VanZ family protein n=1 Tax=Marinoscillum sp. MHG1-6 TaxID=2959627 RepID=UPI0021582141|nr:VanZ family protein [Marinoscillum sp. MHG1-6]